MNRVSYLLAALMALCMLVLIAPGILAMNRGKVLQNIALWLAIVLGLTLVYRAFGPDSPHPLLQNGIGNSSRGATGLMPPATSPSPAPGRGL